MSSLLDLISRRRKMAGGGPVSPLALQNQQIQQQSAAMRFGQGLAAESGALSTAPDALPSYDPATMAGHPANSLTNSDLEVQTTGFAPRMLEAGTLDVTGGLKNALAATAQALGHGPLALSARKSAQEDALRAEKISTDQVKDIRDVGFGNVLPYIGGQILRGAPQIAAAGAGAALAKGFGLPALAGAGLSSVAQNSGQIYQGMQDEADKLPPEDRARVQPGILRDTAIGGLISGALDTGSLGYIFKANPFAKSAMSGLLAKSLPGHMARSILAEGGTEALQQYVQIAAQKHALEHPDMFGLSDEDKWDIANAGAGGAAMALPMAPMGHSSHRIGSGVDKAVDAMGGVARKAFPEKGPEPSGPVEEQPSLASRAGNLLAGAADGNFEQARTAGAALTSKLLDLPGVKSAAQAGKDFWTPLAESNTGTRVAEWVDAKSAAMQKGFDELVKAYGENAKTGNLEDAFEKYKTGFASMVHLDGYDSASLGKMSGEKLAGLVTGFNDVLPKTEGVIQTLFGGVKAGAENAVEGFKANATAENLKIPVPSPDNIAAATSAVGGAAGTVAGKGVHAADELVGGIKDSYAKYAAGHQATPEEATAGVDALRTAFTPPNGDAKLSKVGKPSKDALLIRDAILSLAPKADSTRTLVLAKYIDDMISKKPSIEAFDSFIRTPVVAGLLKYHLKTTPDAFSERILRNLRDYGTEGKSRPSLVDQKVMDAEDKSIDGNAPLETGEVTEPSEAALTEVGSPDESQPRNPAMTPAIFEQMKARDQQLDKSHQPIKAGSNALVRVSKQQVHPDTGAAIGEPSHEDVLLNHLNIAKAWAPQREASQDVRRRGETEQAKFDDNWKQGLGAALQGWDETGPGATAKDEFGRQVETPGSKYRVTVEPRTKTAEGSAPLAETPAGEQFGYGAERTPQLPAEQSENRTSATGFRGWLRNRTLTGPGRAFADVENTDLSRGQKQASLKGALENYHASQRAAGDAVLHVGGTIIEAGRAADKAAWASGREVARIAAEDFSAQIEQLSPERQAAAVDAVRAFVRDPHDEAPAIRHLAIAQLPTDVVRSHGVRLMEALDKIDETVQQRLKGEQETSVDNPNKVADTPGPRSLNEEGVTGSQYVNAAATQEAGKDFVPTDSKARFALDNMKVGKRANSEVLAASKEPAPAIAFSGLADKAKANIADLAKRHDTLAARSILRRAWKEIKNEGQMPENLLKKLAAAGNPSEVARLLTSRTDAYPLGAGKGTEGKVLEEGQQVPSSAYGRTREQAGAAQTKLEDTVRAVKGEPSRRDEAEAKIDELMAKNSVVSARRVVTSQRDGVKKSQADVNSAETPINSTDPAVQAKLVDDIQKITGKSIGVNFDEAQSHQGQYEHAKKLITLAATQSFSASNAAHEAFHAVYDNYLAPEDRKIVYKAFRSAHMRAQIKAFLKDSPDAWEAAKGDPQELMAYGFQAWKAGALHFGPSTNNIFAKVVHFYEKLMAWLHDQPTGEQMQQQIADGAFADGGPSPAEKALARSSEPLRRVQQVTGPVFNWADKLYENLVTPYDTRLRDMGNPYVDQLAKHFYTQTGEKTPERGMVQEIPLQTSKFLNSLDKLARDGPEFEQALKNRANGLAPASALEKRLDAEIEKHYQYQLAAGVKLGKVENYLPMSWDGAKIEAAKPAFIKMLEDHQLELDALNSKLQAESGKTSGFKPLTPDSIYEMMSKRGRVADEFLGKAFDENGVPEANHTLDRVFSFLKNEDRAPFVKDDLHGGLQTYIKQMVRKAEWTRRFKENGFEDLVSQAKDFGLSSGDEKLIRNYKSDAFAARVYEMNPMVRKALAVNTVYQNYRVLSMSLLSNMIDPFGVAVRSGEWSDAWDSYKLAAGRMFEKGRMRTKDLEALGEDIGSIQRASVQDSILERYGGVNIEGKLGKANELLFNYNGMNGLTRSVRLAALVSGINFIKRHAEGYDEHSTRHLAELGLKASDVHVTEGQLDTSSEKIQTALNRFVDESAMRPNVGERTRWGSNPYLAPLYHLKQYVFSFNKVINKKLENELLEHNNRTPYLMAACYVPIMAGTAMLRDMALNGGALPANNGFWHYAGSGIARSGLMGPSDLMELGVSAVALGDMNKGRQLAGPTVDQALDLIGAIGSSGGVHSMRSFVGESLPGGSLLSHYLPK